MLRWLAVSVSILYSVGEVRSADPPSFPTGLPPVFATAVARTNNSTLELTLTSTQARWQLIGERAENADKSNPPKNPEIRVQIERVSQVIALRGPARTAKSETRIVGLDGKDLSHVDIAKRLAKEMAVLIAIDGQMIDPWYLQSQRPETLIVLLGPWDGAPATKLLPKSEENLKPMPPKPEK